VHRFGLVALLAVACGLHAGRVADAPFPAARVVLAPCVPDGLARPARCGTARVFEDRDAGSGRVLELRVVLVAASRPGPHPEPVIVLTGGPGQAATESVADAFFERLLSPTLEGRDVLFIDQRGTERSSPLRCRLVGEDGDLGSLAGGGLPEARLRDCLARMPARAELYATSTAADDLDEIIQRLGYDAVDVAGVSYGTVLAQTLLRRHPARVRAMVLDAVSPVSENFVLHFAENAQRVLDAVLTECAADEACHTAFPDPRGDFEHASERLRRAPTRVKTTTSSGTETATFDAAALAMAVRGLLYTPGGRGRVPALLHAVAGGDDAVAERAVAESARTIAAEMSIGLYLSVTCAENLDGIGDAEAERAAAGSFLGTARIAPVLRACRFWPKARIPADFHEPVRSHAPVLLLGGTLDPATQSEWIERVRAPLAAAQAVIVPGGGHGVNEGCVPSLVARFLDAPTSKLDASCVESVRTTFAQPPKPSH
jgi:pimeloyl-ACP methyl ester carboxylesterase